MRGGVSMEDMLMGLCCYFYDSMPMMIRFNPNIEREMFNIRNENIYVIREIIKYLVKTM